MASPSAWASIQNEPLAPPPPGIVPNLVDPETRAYEIYVAASVCLPLIAIFATMRIYARVTILKRWTWDDLTCALGVIAGIVYLALTLNAATGGVYGKHIYEITFKEYSTEQVLIAFVFEALYGPFIWFVKLSLFVLYVQVFGPLHWLRYLAWAGAIITGLFYFIVMAVELAVCLPQNGHGTLVYLAALDSPRCVSSRRPIVIGLGVVSVLSDLYLIILPLPAVWSLQLPLRRKLAVSAMFFTGSVAFIASCFALAYRIDITGSDPTWKFAPLAVVTNVEFTAGIMVCCMPTTTAVFKQLKPNLSSWIASYQKSLRSRTSSGASKSHELNSVTNLQPSHEDVSLKCSSDLPSDAQNTWEEHENKLYQGPVQYKMASSYASRDASSPYASPDANILKTTDIKVTRQSLV